ncbi:hypothetical protein SV7mr_51020 [Stieleria bergensis]|uniref:Uncharacterized protein n=1 Tax=Stieleria bergensis TaxID=2528025 RepID=A0A517T2G4_9BACT|nr:hypothetical protein SV7mr_51020 [Planctomycetes bacterium SV_7m_r]
MFYSIAQGRAAHPGDRPHTQALHTLSPNAVGVLQLVRDSRLERNHVQGFSPKVAKSLALETASKPPSQAKTKVFDSISKPYECLNCVTGVSQLFDVSMGRQIKHRATEVTEFFSVSSSVLQTRSPKEATIQINA